MFTVIDFARAHVAAYHAEFLDRLREPFDRFDRMCDDVADHRAAVNAEAASTCMCGD